MTSYSDDSLKVAKIHKKVLVDTQWVDKVYIRIPRDYSSRIAQWCHEHYQEPKYLGSWWIVQIDGSITLEEKIYIHWKLCE
jgi:hypothetical protein